MVFTIGNIITLAIVVCFLILYRLTDKGFRSVEKVKKMADKCKEELAAYVEEKSMAVKNFGIDLEVERKAAAQLMNEIQQLTEEELSKKSDSIARIEDHIKAFEASLEELFGMTGRVQENLNRIRDESSFVENTNKRVSEAKEKFEQVERALEVSVKNLQATEERLEKKNLEFLEQAARDVIMSSKSTVNDFEATAQVIERKVEEHREALIKAEHEREASLNRDMEQVKKILKDVLENAGKRADKMEEAALVKLREQAHERVSQIKVFFEEKIKTTQDALKNEQGSITEKIKTLHDKCNLEILDINTKQKNYHQEWVKGSSELETMAKKQREEIITSLARQQEEISSALIKERDSINTSLLQQQNDWKHNFLEFKKAADKQKKDLDISINSSKTELNQSVTDLRLKSQTALKQQHDELDAAIKLQHKEITMAITELKEKTGNAVKHQQQETTDIISKLNTSLADLQNQSKNLQKQQQLELASVLKEVKEKSETAVQLQYDELSAIFGALKENSKEAVRLQQQELSSVLTDLKAKSEAAVSSQQNELTSVLKDIKENSEAAISSQQNELTSALREIKEKTETAVRQQQNEISLLLKELSEKSNTAVLNQHDDINTAINKQMDAWKILCRDTEQNIILANEKRLDEYSKAHSESVSQLNSLADDASRLDTELRTSMQNTILRINKDFAEFEKESGANMERASAEFDSQANALRKELEEMDKELNGIRQQAYDNVSEKLISFENEFTAELGKRASEMGRQIVDWQSGLQERFTNSEGKIMHDWQLAEDRISSEQRKNISVMGDKLISNLERLKQEASAFEMGIREEMNSVDEARVSFAKQLEHDLAEMRISSETEVKAQVGQYQITMQETLRQKQRELEKELDDISQASSNAYANLEETAHNTRQSLDDWQSQYMARMREMDEALEKIGRNSRETADENDERISQFRTNLQDFRKELDEQKKIYARTEILKQELDSRMEETKIELERLNQRKSEITQLENDLNRVKRIEDDVNNKMTRFLSENRRIELMEESFNRLVKISAEVDDKLKSVSSSNDILQAEQIKIRKLEEAIKETENKYLRIEKKNSVLEETTESIDRNFKSLQKTETAIINAENIISTLSGQFDNLRSSIELLAAQDEKASNAVDKISSLDESLGNIEKRIEDMNVAREWLANIETRLNTLNKDAKEYVKLGKALFEREGGKKPASDGAPPPQTRENIKRLWEQGWKADEIASAMGRSIGEIELTLEIITRG